MSLDIAAGQSTGKRELQEDAYYLDARVDPALQEIALAIVADGVGGHGGGNIASQLAVRGFACYVWTALGQAVAPGRAAPICEPAAHDVVGQLCENMVARVEQALMRDDSPRGEECFANLVVVLMGALCFANDELARAKLQRLDLEPMGCTLVAVLIHEQQLWSVSVGDSHVYHLRSQYLEKKNAIHDHGSVLDAKLAAGERISNEEARVPRKTLVSAVTGADLAFIDCALEATPLRSGDLVLLASDGLNGLSAANIVFHASGAESAQALVQMLLQAVAAQRHPRQDNVTVVALAARE